MATNRAALTTLGPLIVVGGVLAGSSHQAAAGDEVVFAGTGTEFIVHPKAEFFASTPVANGTRMEIEATTANVVLAKFLLATPGTFQAIGVGDDPLCFRIELEITRLSDDFDPVFAISDGTSIVAGQIGDNPNGSARAIAGTIAGAAITIIEDPLIFTQAGFVPIGQSLTATVEVTLESAQTQVRVFYLAGDATATTTVTLDPQAELSFMLIANSFVEPFERYGVDQITLLRPDTCPGDIADDMGNPLGDGSVTFGDFLALLGLVGPCPGGVFGCPGDLADDFGTINGGDGMVSFGDFLALLSLVGPCP